MGVCAHEIEPPGVARIVVVACVGIQSKVFQRPTDGAQWWPTGNNGARTHRWFGCRDGVAGGTWLGLGTSGRAGVITNFRKKKQHTVVPGDHRSPNDVLLTQPTPRCCGFASDSLLFFSTCAACLVIAAVLLVHLWCAVSSSFSSSSSSNGDGSGGRHHPGLLSQTTLVAALTAFVVLATTAVRLRRLSWRAPCLKLAAGVGVGDNGSTNKEPPPPSRGKLLMDFLVVDDDDGDGKDITDDDSGGAVRFAKALSATDFDTQRYNGFNLIFGDERNRWFYANHSKGTR